MNSQSLVPEHLEEAAMSYSKQVFHLPEKLVKSQDWAKRELLDLRVSLMGFKPEEDTVGHLQYLPADFHIINPFMLNNSNLSLPAGHAKHAQNYCLAIP